MPSGLSLALLMIAIAMLSTVHGVHSNTHSKDSNTGVDAKDAEIARLRVKVERLRADLHSSNDQEDQWMSESGPNAKDKNGPRRNGVAYYCQHDASKSSYYANCDTCVSTPICCETSEATTSTYDKSGGSRCTVSGHGVTPSVACLGLQIPLSCPGGGKGRFTVAETEKKVEYWRNHPLSSSEDFDRAVIIIHGNARNADDYFDAVKSTAQSYSNALVLVPKFKTAEDEPKEDELYWSTSGWSKGFKSQDGTETASFAVIDDMLESISSRFPRVTEIVIAGHSAGGQFVQRYAGVGKAPVTIPLRYVVANPSTYMFLDNTRPEGHGNCLSSYDEYKYGMSNLPGNLHYTNLSQTEIQRNLVNREVSLLLGKDDNKRVTPMDLSCEADAQGRHRYIRGMNYRDHINHFAASNPDFNGVHTTVTKVPGVGHDYKGMFTSTAGIESLFAVLSTAPLTAEPSAPLTAEPSAPPTAEPTNKGTTGPRFTLGQFKKPCVHNAGLQTSVECFAAVQTLVQTLDLTIRKSLTKNSKNFPTGCSIRTKKGVRVAFFNTRFGGKARRKFQLVCKAGS